MEEQKSFGISKRSVWEAWKKVRANQGAAGVDAVTIAQFEARLSDNLYKVWNRMASGSYFPPPVKRVLIPKTDGGERPLGIPTVGDRIAQMVAKQFLEPLVEPVFHQGSYAYRPGKSALDAVGEARQRCWQYDWVIDLDIKGFFDNIDDDLMMRALRKHTDCKWVLLYVERWLKAPVLEQDGIEHARDRGTPQGGVVSPLLANLFLHYVLDAWMVKYHPNVPFERYADDSVYHCASEAQAQLIRRELEERLQQCGLQAHPEKTRIVYCKDSNRKGTHEHMDFDFLGYQFRPRKAKNPWGQYFTSFAPGCSPKALKRMGGVLRSWSMHRRSEHSLGDLARAYGAVIRGWTQYYGQYYRTALYPLLHRINRYLVRWARRKYKRFRRQRRATRWLRRIAKRQPELFSHWQLGAKP
jgi:group II intron reverse transcriptase/maturase|tara:strand:+ start:517 stop:1752 length:1236 start_codon:yes stop_codon:yes gene_type:complete